MQQWRYCLGISAANNDQGEAIATILLINSAHKLSIMEVNFASKIVNAKSLSQPVPHLSNFDLTSTSNYAVWIPLATDFLFTGKTR